MQVVFLSKWYKVYWQAVELLFRSALFCLIKEGIFYYNRALKKVIYQKKKNRIYLTVFFFIFSKNEKSSFMFFISSTTKMPFLPTCFNLPLLVPFCKNNKMPLKNIALKIGRVGVAYKETFKRIVFEE